MLSEYNQTAKQITSLQKQLSKQAERAFELEFSEDPMITSMAIQ